MDERLVGIAKKRSDAAAKVLAEMDKLPGPGPALAKEKANKVNEKLQAKLQKDLHAKLQAQEKAKLQAKAKAKAKAKPKPKPKAAPAPPTPPADDAAGDRRVNSELLAAKKAFREFVATQKVEPKDYVATLKKFFGKGTLMSSLWAELKRQRKGADTTIQEAWVDICGGAAPARQKNAILWSMVTEPPGCWQARLMEHVSTQR